MGKAERTKQFIIEQAAPIFNEKGIAGTTIDDVLNAAKVAKGCLYNHFESKEDLANATIDFLLEKITTGIRIAMDKEKTSKAKIFAYLNFSKYPLDTYVTGGCPIFNMAVEADNNNPVVKKKIKEVMLEGQQNFIRILNEGIKNGEWADTLDAKQFAFNMFAAIEGATVVCRILDSNQPMQGVIKSLKAELSIHEIN